MKSMVLRPSEAQRAKEGKTLLGDIYMYFIQNPTLMLDFNSICLK